MPVKADLRHSWHSHPDERWCYSQGVPENNRLVTGTPGFNDIRNEADYKVSHTGISLSRGGDATLASNAMSNVGNVLWG